MQGLEKRKSRSLRALRLARTGNANQRFGGSVANACNACHKQFRVPTRIVPFSEKRQDEDDEDGE